MTIPEKCLRCNNADLVDISHMGGDQVWMCPKCGLYSKGKSFPVFAQRWDDRDEPIPDTPHEQPRTLTDYAEDVIKAADKDVLSQEFEDALKLLTQRVKMHREAVAKVEYFDVFNIEPMSVIQAREEAPKKIAVRFNTEHNGSGFNWRILVEGEPELLVEEFEVHTMVLVETFMKPTPDGDVLKGNIVMRGYVDKSLLGSDGRGTAIIFGKHGTIPHEEDLAAWVGECHFVNQELLEKLDAANRLAKAVCDNLPGAEKS